MALDDEAVNSGVEQTSDGPRTQAGSRRSDWRLSDPKR